MPAMSKNVEMVAGDFAENVCRGQDSLAQTSSGKSLIGILVRRYGNDLSPYEIELMQNELLELVSILLRTKLGEKD